MGVKVQSKGSTWKSKLNYNNTHGSLHVACGDSGYGGGGGSVNERSSGGRVIKHAAQVPAQTTKVAPHLICGITQSESVRVKPT